MAIHKRSKSINDINAQVARIVNSNSSPDRKRLATRIGDTYKANIEASKPYRSIFKSKKEEGYNNDVGRNLKRADSRHLYSTLYAEQESKRMRFSQSTYRGLSEG